MLRFWLLAALWLHVLATHRHGPLARRQSFLPRCKYDEHIIKSEEKLALQINAVDYVFTGKVTSDVHYNNDSTISFFVSIKRFFKNTGDLVLNNHEPVKVLKTLYDGEGVKCRQVLRPRYTAIFVGRKPQELREADVHLAISPVPVSLTNLDRVSAATKDEGGQFLLALGDCPEHANLLAKPEPQNIRFDTHEIESCDKTFCAWGAGCKKGNDGRVFCHCLTPSECTSVTPKDTVCGTDGKTYASVCYLRIASCKARRNTRVKHAGECEQSDPCRDKQCGFGARCVVSPDGRNASCLCPDKCPSYGDHTTSRPMCGSDGVDYRNQCELQRAACTSNTNITAKFSGKCDPCTGVECAEPEVCQLDEQRNPVCKCGDSCPLEFTPVCGSDGKTYSNECTLRQEACRARKTLNIIYRGKCSSGINPCMSVRCTLGEECAINKFGIAHCQCMAACEPVMRPVCSKDGRTYPSECELRRAGCLARTTIEAAYAGVCGEKGPCSEHECQYGATCVERSGSAHCECPICPAEFEPVCGSDGISYGNECKLRLEACKHRRDIAVLYDGPCNGCENKKCDFYSTCENDGATEGRCVCPATCGEAKLNNGTVCGTDGVSYANECELRITSCKTKQYILVAYKGNCDLCQAVECKYGGRCEAGECVCPTNCEGSGAEPVCASNMMTFTNECELQKAMCLQPTNSPPLSVVFYGDCRERFPVAGSLSTTLSPNTAQTNLGLGTDSPPDNSIPDLSTAEKEACRDIHCDFEATCELGPDNFPRCSCQFDCLSAALVSVSKPVCASDLRVYPSLCAMKMEACQRQEELRLRPLDLCQGMEVKPCNGEKPLTDPVSGKEFDCGNGPKRQDCPSGSYCHQTTRFARCCRKDIIEEQKSCEDSWYGCCPDGKTSAQGPSHAGCPSLCGCNKLGSYSDTCDPETQQCRCRPGVGGAKCDRCEPGYWGLPKISSGHHGCIPCGCSTFGSVRDDCEQMTGRCVCNPGVQGQKCTVCTSHNKVLGPNGCVPADLTTSTPTTCKELTCYFGATCVERGGLAICECHTECPQENDAQVVCGSNGQTYSTSCELSQIACRSQKDIVVTAFGTCKEDMFTSTDWPVRRYTPLQFTQPDDSNSPLSKSTRHLLVPDPRYYYERSGTMLRPLPGVSYPAEGNNKPESDINVSASGPANSIYNTRGGNYAPAYRPTPATVRVVTALLGDLCSDNSDCMILYSHCVAGACTCLPDHSESSDRQECIVDPQLNPTDEYRACSSSPCHQASTCVDLPAATFTCVCGANFTGALCDAEVVHKQYDTPSFHGRSFVKLKPLKAYHKLSVEVEFKSHSYDGLLLYNQQKADGSGDFLSLALVHGFVEFKYNLGNGEVLIRSVDKVQLGYYHRVVIKRYHRDGILKLDEGEDVAGQAQGSLKALDLLEDTFIGYIPTNYTRVYENVGVRAGFRGCIKQLKIGRKPVELHVNRDDWVLTASGVSECGGDACRASPCEHASRCTPVAPASFRCECGPGLAGEFCERLTDPCRSSPCLGGAPCSSLDGDQYTCECPPGRAGFRCEIEDKYTGMINPEFNGSSYIRLPRLEGIKKTFSIEVYFMPKAANGLILYNGQMRNGRGDFISLNIARGHLQFRFNLGSGIANLTTKQTVNIGKWHWARIFREGREGILQLDNSSMVRGYSGTPLTELNLELPFYIGSLSSWDEVHRLSGASKGYKGVIQRILVNGKPLSILSKLSDCSFDSNRNGCAFNVKSYDGLPCPLTKNPCLNEGICIPELDQFTCKCPHNVKGKYCEISVQDEAPAIQFNGDTFLQFRNRGYRSSNTTNDDYIDNDEDDVDTIENEQIDNNTSYFNQDDYFDLYDNNNNNYKKKPERGNRYEISLRTFGSDALILWRSKSRSIEEDYFSIAIVDGYPEMSYNLGKQDVFWAIRSKTKIDDGKWHTIQVRRRKRVGFISIDGEPPTRGIAKYGAISLRTNSKLWIGGTATLPQGLPSAYYKGFEGCIQHILVNAKLLDITSNHNEINKISFCHDNEI